MRRRTFVAGSSAVLGSFLAWPLRAQTYPQPVRRAAVVIGLDRTGDLPVLKDAETGATDFADFLEDGGFDPVLRFLGADGPVTVPKLKQAVRSLTDPPVLDQLVIYFAGHGIMPLPANEKWLLSEAPEDADSAVSVRECFEAARASNIANVVLIGDTCRSIPPSAQYSAIQGSVIFPNLPTSATATRIDVFYAAQPGEPALEVRKSSGAYRALLTRTLIDVFRNPELNLDRSLFEPMPDGTSVVTNRMLMRCLPGLVDARAQEANIQFSQLPQLDILSDEPWNIGHIAFPFAVAAAPASEPPPMFTVPDVLRFQVQRPDEGIAALIEAAKGEANSRLGTLIRQTSAQLNASVERQNADIELEKAGIAVYGASIARVVATPGLEVKLPAGGAGEASTPSVVSLDLGDRPAATLVVQFDGGMGAPIAVLKDFGTHVTVGEGGITDLRYTPIKDGGVWWEFDSERQRLTELRALVREASKRGVLGFDGNAAEREEAAGRMADQIRMLKGIDPTLGIYAAYAYDTALLPDQVKSVAEILQGNLGVRLFDPEMLAWAFAGQLDETGEIATGAGGVFPFCPVLRQGWELLRVKQARLAESVLAARPQLLTSFITTFSAPGVEVIADAVERGELQ